MTQNISDLSADAVFQLRLQQAILVSQHTVKQVGLLLVGFDCPDYSSADLMRMPNFSESVWTRLRNTLRDSDTVVRRDTGEMAVLLPSVNGSEDVVIVAKKVLEQFTGTYINRGPKNRYPTASGHRIIPGAHLDCGDIDAARG